MKLTRIVLCGLVLFLSIGCQPKAEEKIDFVEIRLHRWTALEGGETLVLRRVGKEWSGILLGDGQRFSCLYEREVMPRSNWDQLWSALVAKGLMEIPEGQLGKLIVEDGDGFEGEITYAGKVTRFDFPHPQQQDFVEAKQILEIGDLIADEFESPVFRASYDRGAVSEYLIKQCEGIKREFAR